MLTIKKIFFLPDISCWLVRLLSARRVIIFNSQTLYGVSIFKVVTVMIINAWRVGKYKLPGYYILAPSVALWRKSLAEKPDYRFICFFVLLVACAVKGSSGQ